ncbi:MAG: hypothetical protein J2P37_28700, partial [Ktedonobacteraceae bacterium]|nr:hypothetical protein [Ktedonobacteraceae bacterium]
PRATRAQLQRQTTRQMTTQHGRRALQKAPNIQAPVSSSCRNSRRSKQPKHPLFYIGGTAGGLLGGYILLTYLVGWCVTHLSDPGSFGPTHGNIVVGVFGGGDSQVKPSKLIALNNNGHVQLMKITSNDPAKTQILVGPDLGRLEFPDPAGAEIQMEVGDYDHDGHTDVKVSILGTTFTSPFTRYRSQYVLYGDGKGGLKQRPQ